MNAGMLVARCNLLLNSGLHCLKLLISMKRNAGSGSRSNPLAIQVESTLPKVVRTAEIFKSNGITVMGLFPCLVGADSFRIP